MVPRRSKIPAAVAADDDFAVYAIVVTMPLIFARPAAGFDSVNGGSNRVFSDIYILDTTQHHHVCICVQNKHWTPISHQS